MADQLQIIDVTSSTGAVAHPDWLARAEPVHRELRRFRDGHDGYLDTMTRIFAGGGRMRIAVAAIDGAVASVAVYRVYEKSHPGLQMYVDDLVTAAGGSISAEHGIGVMKKGELERLSPDRVRTLRAIKASLDPKALMNPGKLV